MHIWHLKIAKQAQNICNASAFNQFKMLEYVLNICNTFACKNEKSHCQQIRDPTFSAKAVYIAGD